MINAYAKVIFRMIKYSSFSLCVMVTCLCTKNRKKYIYNLQKKGVSSVFQDEKNKQFLVYISA